MYGMYLRTHSILYHVVVLSRARNRMIELDYRSSEAWPTRPTGLSRLSWAHILTQTCANTRQTLIIHRRVRCFPSFPHHHSHCSSLVFAHLLSLPVDFASHEHMVSACSCLCFLQPPFYPFTANRGRSHLTCAAHALSSPTFVGTTL